MRPGSGSSKKIISVRLRLRSTVFEENRWYSPVAGANGEVRPVCGRGTYSSANMQGYGSRSGLDPNAMTLWIPDPVPGGNKMKNKMYVLVFSYNFPS
jgi:hypothetical protein